MKWRLWVEVWPRFWYLLPEWSGPAKGITVWWLCFVLHARWP